LGEIGRGLPATGGAPGGMDATPPALLPPPRGPATAASQPMGMPMSTPPRPFADFSHPPRR
ncbi:MAG: hypothetical protein RMK49_19595, partial [Abditibacteriales bacterium]|nr:hypothetical protein [Abditibacteriales bacterium]